MKTILLFVVSLAFSLYVQGGEQVPAPDNSQALANADMAPALNSLVDALDALEGKTPTSVQLSQIGAAWKRLPEPAKGELREDVIYMSCAGLLAIGDMKSFGNARSAIPDMDAFREEIMGPCPECDGSGLVKSRCTSCGGSGRCGRCGGRGMIAVPHLAGARVPPPVVCGSCSGSGHCANCNKGMKEIRHAPCSGTGKRISRERSLEAFESHRAKVREGAFAIIQKEKGLVLRDGDWVSPAEAAERDRLAQEEQRLAEEEEKREEKFAEYQRSRGLVLVDDKWMTQGSRRDIVLTVLQKLQVEGITMRRDPMSGEHGGLLCLDATDDVGCIIVSNREWHNAEEGSTYRFDLYRCGLYSYTTKSGERNTVRLYATDLDTALQEIKDRRFSKRF